MAAKRKCAGCRKVLKRGAAKLCQKCYHARGPLPADQRLPRRTCPDCGGRVSRGDVLRCRRCDYTYRQSTARGRTLPMCRICRVRKCTREATVCRTCFQKAPNEATAITAAAVGNLDDAVRKALKTGAKPVAELASLLSQTPGQMLDLLIGMRDRGVNLHQIGDRWSIERIPVSLAGERTFEYISRPDGTFHFGVSSDQHLCSRYARQDVLEDLYDEFSKAGVDRVFNAGNWIDGEDEKNRFDLEVHGFEPQIRHLVEHYPERPGITTFAVWGEDHEGWYARREAIDVGRFAEQQMRAAGRQDWVDLGFIEARVDLVHAETGARASLVVMHPGGGSSYAYSYRPQKIVESLSGGEKPGVLLIGHYHKLSCNLIRNVWTMQAGTTMDQSVFMRKKGLEAHVGGFIVTLQMDPKSGAIYRCVADQRCYYDRAYYNDRWSKTRPVVQAPRFDNGVRAVR